MRHAGFRQLLSLVAIVLALAGAWASGALLLDHDGGWHAESAGTAFLLRLCEPESMPSVSCSGVVNSRWGSFDFFAFGHSYAIPTSFLGLAYFTVLAIWFAVVIRVVEPGRWLRRCTVLVVACGLFASVLLTALMALTLSEWCPLCVVAHLCNAGIFVATVLFLGLGTKRETREASTADRPDLVILRRRIVLTGGLACSVAVGGLWFYYDGRTEARRQWRKARGYADAIAVMQNDPSFVLREHFAGPVVHVPMRGEEPPDPTTQTGPTLVIFTDLDSSACACFDGQWDFELRDLFGEGLRVEYRYMSATLGDGTGVRTGTMGEPGRAARAAQAARLQGDDTAYLGMHRLLFEHRKDQPGRNYADLAHRAGLDVERFLDAMQSEAVRDAVLADQALADRLEVITAPAVFLNGRKVPDLCLKSPVFWTEVAAGAAGQRDAVVGPVQVSSADGRR